MTNTAAGIIESVPPQAERQAPARLRQMRSLLWKELRERWGQAATLLAVGLLIAGGWGWFMDVLVARDWPGSLPDAENVLLLFWTVVALMASAPVLADERSRASLSFVLAQPISQSKAWWWKLGSAALFVAVVVGPSWCVYHIAAPSRWPPAGQSPFAVPCAMAPAAVFRMILGWPPLFFSAGLLATALVEGTVTALGLGAVIAVLLSSVLTYYGIKPDGPGWALSCTTLSLALLATSHLSFCARQFWPWRPRRLAVAICLTWACLSIAGISTHLAWRRLGNTKQSIAEIRSILSPGGVPVYVCRTDKGELSLRLSLDAGALLSAERATVEMAPDTFTLGHRSHYSGRRRAYSGYSRCVRVTLRDQQAIVDPVRATTQYLEWSWQEAIRRSVARQLGTTHDQVEVFAAQTPASTDPYRLFCMARVRGSEWLAIGATGLLNVDMPPDAKPLAWSAAVRGGMYVTGDGKLGFMRATGYGWPPPQASISDVSPEWHAWTPQGDVFVFQPGSSGPVSAVIGDRRKTQLVAIRQITGRVLDVRWHERDGTRQCLGLVVGRADGARKQELWACWLTEDAHATCERLIETNGRVVCSGSHRPLGTAYVVTPGSEERGDLWLVRKAKARCIVKGGVRAARHQAALQGAMLHFIRHGRELWQFDPVKESVARVWPGGDDRVTR